MPGKLQILFVLLVFTLKTLSAQDLSAEYGPYETAYDSYALRVTTDSALFYRAVQADDDLFGNSVRYRFGFTRNDRRGRSNSWSTTIGTLRVAGDYAPLLRMLGMEENRTGGLWYEGTPESSMFPSDDPMPRAGRASVRFSGRGYTAGVRGAFLWPLRRDWELAVGLDARTGRDLYVEGVFTQAAQAGLRLAKRFSDGGCLTLLGVVPPSMRGLRAATTPEAARLTDNPLYNPVWGYQQGRVRNSRVRRQVRPLAAAVYRRPLGASTILTLAATAEAGLRRTSGLGWYDARNRMPDNYRYMPSYVADPDRRAELEAVWRSGDARYTQIDWEELYRENGMSGGSAAYFVADRAERLLRMQLSATGRTDRGSVVLHYGIEAGYERMRRYRQMRDLLGGQYLIDRDQYLLDDDAYGTLLQNDLRHPDRIVHEGDRFGYDYASVESLLRIWAEGEYRTDRFRAGVRVVLGSRALRRRGYYEKELFPGAASYGPSRRLGFAPYALAVRVGWAFTPRCYLEAVVRAAAEAPAFDALFLNPEYNNRSVDDPSLRKSVGAEINLTWLGRDIDLRGSLFASLTTDGLSIVRYFDDASSRFCDRVASGIGIRSLGVELAAEIRLAYRWRLTLAASAASYRYVRNPRVTVYDDRDNALVDDRAESYMGGCRVGGTPGLTAFAGVNYFGPKGWGVKCSAAWADERYVEPEPLRRTVRIAGQLATSPETFDAFTVQERLPAALSVDASLFKTFYFDRSRLTLACSVTNLLGERRDLYAGYESIRVVTRRAGDAQVSVPHDTRYLAAYPRTFFLSVSYLF